MGAQNISMPKIGRASRQIHKKNAILARKFLGRSHYRLAFSKRVCKLRKDSQVRV